PPRAIWRRSARRTMRKRFPTLPAQRDQARGLVQAAGAERLEIDGDEFEAGGLQRGQGVRAQAHEAIEVGLPGLDARDLSMIAHAEFAQPQLAERHLALGELRESLRRHLGSVRNPRGETRLLWFVPGGKLQVAAQL